MAVARSLRRNTTITYFLAALLLLTFLYFFLVDSTSLPSLPQSRQLLKSKDAASNPLSPPSLPFKKQDPNEVPPPPPVVHYHMNNVTTSSQPIENRESVLILTPLAKFYSQYWDNLLSLSYPHDLISLGFIIPKGREGNEATRQLQDRITKTQAPSNKKHRFASITILRQDDEPPTAQSESERHALSHQKVRRAAMSRARNSLLFTTLGPTTSWVLWLDADVIETPPSLIQDLASHDKPIIVPNCMQRYWNKDKGAEDVRPYDFNSWQDSPTALGLAEKMGPDEILLEGYAEMATYRSLMAYMGEPTGDAKKIVDLDGVGGTALLVKAEVHRDGAMFPPFPFYHLIETEGFAKMARRLGWKSFGLPNFYLEQSWDLDAVFALHTPDFTHTLLPAAIGGPPRNNAEARKHCEALKPIWKEYKITKRSEVHDAEEHRAALHTLTVAETTAGHFEMEAMWMLHFNEDGTKLKGLEQLVDSRAVGELFEKIGALTASGS
ncbi:hypothetical protein B0A48_04317 [Cryoendolithus antarcticus]|uniref:Glycosyltransferase family 62 protein n=1 Tax=Cryoendolithus antarcticus TaxID=1507870 RepID=A0A1V8TFH0_9PEZI|nr:hypothetical protein B0A48_04317 [Cryoendolithus antarcticus]